MSKSKARGWLTIGFGIVYGGLLYGSILAAAHKADPKFSLWKLDKPREYATPNQDAGNKWQATGYHDSQPAYLTVLSQLGAQVSGYQKAQYTDPDRYRENERADRDLRAQEEMADWAFWVMILTGATVAVTCAGVILVGFTLLETKRLRGEAEKTTRAAMAAVTSSDRAADATVRAANSAADANDQARTFFVEQQRARLSVDAAVSKVSWEGENAQFEIAIKVDNTGHSNAENVLPHPLVIVHPLPSLDTIKRIIDERISRVSTFGYTIESGRHIAYKHNIEIGEEGIREWRNDDELNASREIFIIPTLLICVTYNITFDKAKRHTTIVREVRRIDDIVHKTGFSPSHGVITNEKIATQRHIRGDMFAT